MKKYQQLYDELIKMRGVDKASLLGFTEDITPKFSYSIASDGYEVIYKATYLIDSAPAENNIIERVTIMLAERDDRHPEIVFHANPVNKSKVDLVIEVEFTETAKFNLNPDGDWIINNEKHSLDYSGFTPATAEAIEFREAVANEL